eukprot:10578996-Alexandrium_andersonii.AAC.1
MALSHSADRMAIPIGWLERAGMSSLPESAKSLLNVMPQMGSNMPHPPHGKDTIHSDHDRRVDFSRGDSKDEVQRPVGRRPA